MKIFQKFRIKIRSSIEARVFGGNQKGKLMMKSFIEVLRENENLSRAPTVLYIGSISFMKVQRDYMNHSLKWSECNGLNVLVRSYIDCFI